MTKHRQDYAKWLTWIERCGLSEEAFLSECRTTHEMDYTQDSYDSLPACLRGKQAVEEMEPSSRQVEPSSRRCGTKEPKRSNQAVDGCSRGDRCNRRSSDLCKSRGDSRSIGRWSFQAITYLWETVADIVRKHGIAWSVWRSVRPIATVSAMPSLPLFLTVESSVELGQAEMAR